MKIKDFRKRFPINAEEVEIIPTVQLEQHYFDNHDKGDYREEAIDTSIKLNLPLSSTQNNIYNLMKRFVKVTCPKCGKNTKPEGAGGNGDFLSTTYYCDNCRTKFNITLPTDGINIIFKE